MKFPLAIFLSLCAAAHGAIEADSDFDFGKVVTGAVVENGFALKNTGTSPVKIQSLRKTPPLALVPVPAEILPGETALLRFKLDTSGLTGPYNGAIQVTFNDPAQPAIDLSFEGNIVPKIEVSPMPAVWLAGQRGVGNTASVDIINHEPDPLRIEKIAFTS